MKNIILTTLFLLAGVGVHAAGNVDDDYSMVPTRFETQMKLGETREFNVRISNNMKKKKMDAYQISLLDFDLNEQGILNTPVKNKNPRGLLPYSRVSAEVFSVNALENHMIKIIVTIPKDFKYGSGYVVYKLGQEVDAGLKGSGIGFTKNYYGFIAINISENEKKEISIEKVYYKDSRLTVELKNVGESFLKTSSNIVVMDGDKKVGVFELLDDKSRKEFLNIPDTTRKVFSIIPDSLFKSIKRPRATVIVSDVKSGYLKSMVLEIKK